MIEHLKNSLGISCVEIYLLALLKAKGIDCKRLYLDSFTEISDVVTDFEEFKCNFVTYDGLRRLQDIARKEGMISIVYSTEGLNRPYQYIMRGVKPDYKQSNFMPWRNDHFLLRYDGEYYDCYPPSVFEVTDDSIFDGRKIGVDIIPNFTGCPEKDYTAELKERIICSEANDFNFKLTGDNLTIYRDALLIVKISRQRVNEILCSEIIAEEIKEIVKLINKIEIFRQRGKIGEYKSNIDKINELEGLWRARI